jgi:hypothetical protein
VPSVSRRKGPIHLGLDVHKDSISVAILHPNDEAVDVFAVLRLPVVALAAVAVTSWLSLTVRVVAVQRRASRTATRTHAG